MSDSGGAFTLWLTGLPCSGKTTIARELAQRFLEMGILVELFDGDVVREHLSHGLDFSKEARDINVKRIAFLAQLLTRNGTPTIVAAISPYREARQSARALIGSFVEVHVDCSLAECQARDVKGMYQRAARGEIKHFTGVDDPYEVPESPEVLVRTEEQSVEQSVETIFSHLFETQRLPTTATALREQLRARTIELGLGELRQLPPTVHASGRHRLARRLTPTSSPQIVPELTPAPSVPRP